MLGEMECIEEVSEGPMPSLEEAAIAPNECVICCDNLYSETKATIVGCDHSFCLVCILRWYQLKGSCPLCNGAIKTIECLFDLDGTFCPEGVTNLAHLLIKARWLEIPDLQEDDSFSDKYDDHIILERNSFGDYVYDVYEDVYEPSNYAPSRGKSGRDRKFESGGGVLEVSPSQTSSQTCSRRRRTVSLSSPSLSDSDGSKISATHPAAKIQRSLISISEASSSSSSSGQKSGSGRRAKRAQKRILQDSLENLSLGRLSI